MAGLNYYTVAIAPGISALKNAHAFITKGHKHVLSNNIDPETFLSASIHPDMRDFRAQVYYMTDAIKSVPSRLNSALEPLPIPDDQKSFEELLARIEKTIKYLESFKESDFDGKVEDEVVFKWPAKQVRMQPMEYVGKWAHANMWFHIMTAYNILRMKGVDVGKLDFLNGGGVLNIEDVEA